MTTIIDLHSENPVTVTFSGDTSDAVVVHWAKIPLSETYARAIHDRMYQLAGADPAFERGMQVRDAIEDFWPDFAEESP